MEITIPYSNPEYDEIIERKGRIIVYKDNVEVWFGEVRDVAVDFNKNKSIYVVGEASYLNDTVQPQKQYKNQTKYQIFTQIISNHNAMVEPAKRFTPGTIGKDANKKIDVVTDWEYTLDAIREHLCEKEEYFRVRHIGGERYIDIMPLDSYGKKTDQNILFGENLLDYAEDSSGADIATVCIPLGVKLEESVIEGYDNYLTCTKANNGKNYVELPGAVNRLGRITRVVHFNVLNTPEALVTAAVNWLQSAQYAKLTLNLSAVDLSVLHNDIDDYKVGDYIRAICEPMGMDSWFPVRKRDTDLLNISNNKIVIGSEGVKGFTTQQSETFDAIEELIPNKDNILSAALKNASALINSNGTNGYVSIRTDENGKPYEIIVANADSIEQATQAWRWNLKGFGHGTKKAGAKDYTWEADVAMTMDGAVNADFITTGTIDANVVNVTNVTAASVDASNITGDTISGKELDGCTLKTATGKDYVEVKEGDVFGGSASGQHGYLTFSTKSGSDKGVALTGENFINLNGKKIYINGTLYPGSQAAISKILSLTNVYVDGSMRQAVALTFTNGLLTNVSY